MMNEKQTTDRFLLVDESKTWLVEQGNADLFLVDVEGEELIGPLFHALTVAAGGVVLGTGRAEWQGRTVTMVCQPRSGAVLESMPRTEAEGDPLKLWMRELREAAELDASTAFHDLSALHKTSLEALADKREAIEQTETARLQLKDDARSATVNRALRDLGSVLHIGEDAEIAAPGTGMNVLAACRMIGRHLGVEMRMPKGFTASGNPLNDAAVLARASSVRYRDVVLKGAWWKQDNGPLLAFRPSETGNAPAVALALIRRGRAYFVSDTEKGTRDRLTPELASSIAPKAVMFYRPFPPRPLGWSDLLLFGLHGTWRDVFTMLAVGAATGLLALLMPVATGILFDTIIPGAQRGQLYQMAVMLFAANITTFLISLTSNVAMQRMEGRMEAGVQSAVWDRLLSLPVHFFKDYNSGDLVSRSLAIGQIRQMLTGAVLTSLLTGVFSIFSFILLFQYSSSLALIATALVLVAALMSAGCGWLQMKNQRAI